LLAGALAAWWLEQEMLGIDRGSPTSRGTEAGAARAEIKACMWQMSVAKLALRCYKRVNGQGYQHLREPGCHEGRRISGLAKPACA